MEQRKWRTEAALVGRVLVWGAARRSGVGFQPRSPVGGGRHRARWVAAFRLSRLVSSHWTRKKTAPPPPPCSRESDADVFGRLLRRLRIGGFFFYPCVCVCVASVSAVRQARRNRNRTPRKTTRSPAGDAPLPLWNGQCGPYCSMAVDWTRLDERWIVFRTRLGLSGWCSTRRFQCTHRPFR